jgi:phenylpyruvate tautomerase PptA (4-oxalocrotonate tautomerase family)
MPLVKVEIYKGKPKEYKRAILDGIHDALVTAFKIPDDDRNQRLYELTRENFERRNNKSLNFTIIEITAFKGRTRAAKKLLFAEIVKNLSHNPGINGDDILIILNEPPLENWGVFGGKPASEVDLGFSIKV